MAGPLDCQGWCRGPVVYCLEMLNSGSADYINVNEPHSAMTNILDFSWNMKDKTFCHCVVNLH